MEFTCLSLASLFQYKTEGMPSVYYELQLRIIEDHIRISLFVLNFLSHGPYEQLNPGFSGNSHLFSLTDICTPCMGKSKGNFSPISELQGNTSTSLIVLPHIRSAHYSLQVYEQMTDGWQSKC